MKYLLTLPLLALLGCAPRTSEQQDENFALAGQLMQLNALQQGQYIQQQQQIQQQMLANTTPKTTCLQYIQGNYIYPMC